MSVLVLVASVLVLLHTCTDLYPELKDDDMLANSAYDNIRY